MDAESAELAVEMANVTVTDELPFLQDAHYNLKMPFSGIKLNLLSSLAKISQTAVVNLKDSFNLLHDTLKGVHSCEVRLLGEAKRRRLQLEVQSVEELQSPSEEPDGEVSKLKWQLLQVNTELRAAEGRGHTARHGPRRLQRETQTQPAKVEGNVLKDRRDVLRKEDFRTLMDNLETLETLLSEEQKELEKMIEIKAAEKAQLPQLREKTRQMEALKRVEHAVAASVLTVHLQGDTSAVLDAVPQRKASAQQKGKLEKDLDALKASFQRQVMAEEETQRKHRYGMIQELLKESKHPRQELHHLGCLRQNKEEDGILSLPVVAV
uniref:Uncharacterized protein n=1 Tax=Fundulus heteroclitus TaxID=8078 RepID=A0A3Q2NY98_FUNHE